MMNVLELIEDFGKKENSLHKREFISPVHGNDTVVMKLDGIVFTFGIDRREPGWYKFRPTKKNRARKVSEADFSEREAYLKKLPQIRVYSCYREDTKIFGLPMKNNKVGLSYQRLVPVYLPDDMPMDFDRILCRFDGANLWYEDLDMSNDPTKASYLRDSLTESVKPEVIKFSGLSLEERAAYAVRYKIVLERKKEQERLAHKEKLRTLEGQIEFHGGRMINCNERSDHIEVEIEVDGQSFRSYVSKDESHHVITAGICLDGMDKAYDVTSLISVFREGVNRGLIHRTLYR